MFKNMKIGMKLGISFGIVIAIIIFIAVLIINVLTQVEAKSKILALETVRKIELLSTITDNANAVVIGYGTLIILDDDLLENREKQNIANLMSENSKLLEELNSMDANEK